MPDHPGEKAGETALERWTTARNKAVQEWKKWYLAVRPDAEFEE
jgi:hypothetical protein